MDALATVDSQLMRLVRDAAMTLEPGPLEARECMLVRDVARGAEVSEPTDVRERMLVELATAVTHAPWALSRTVLARAHAARLGDEDVLHAILLAAYEGFVDRIEPRGGTSAPRPSATASVARRPAIDLARRPATSTAFTQWRHYMFYARDVPITRRQRTLIARWVATWLGDGGISSPADLTVNPLDDSLRAIADLVTHAPWQVDDQAGPLREVGFDDRAIFEICATAASAGMFSRIEVALAALAA